MLLFCKNKLFCHKFARLTELFIVKKYQKVKIVVNVRLLLKDKLEGIGWFTYETLKRITIQHPEVEFYFLFDRKPDPKFIFGPNVKPIVIAPQARHPFLFFLWFEFSVTRILKKIKPDLFLSPDGYLSLRTKTPSMAIIHDLNFEHFPKDLPLIDSWYYRYFFPRFAKKAIRIGTVSEFSKKDIFDCYQVPLSHIDVIYNGVNDKFSPIQEEEIQEVRENYCDGKPYFMFVGSLHPRKNLARLFTSFDLFKKQTKSDTKLLIVGQKKWWTEPIKQAYEKMDFKDDVIFAGRLSAEDLHKITAASLASIYVSYFEGFGIPIVEGFRCGVPVITSNVTSMPEVADDAALLVDPFDEQSIAEAMSKIDSDENLRIDLVKKGMERAKFFTWDKAANRLWNSILKAID